LTTNTISAKVGWDVSLPCVVCGMMTMWEVDGHMMCCSELILSFLLLDETIQLSFIHNY